MNIRKVSDQVTKDQAWRAVQAIAERIMERRPDLTKEQAVAQALGLPEGQRAYDAYVRARPAAPRGDDAPEQALSPEVGKRWESIRKHAATLAGSPLERMTTAQAATAVDRALTTPEGGELYRAYNEALMKSAPVE